MFQRHVLPLTWLGTARWYPQPPSGRPFLPLRSLANGRSKLRGRPSALRVTNFLTDNVAVSISLCLLLCEIHAVSGLAIRVCARPQPHFKVRTPIPPESSHTIRRHAADACEFLQSLGVNS